MVYFVTVAFLFHFYFSAEGGDERVERPFEKPDRERERERDKDRERDRDRDRERDGERDRDRRKQRREDMAPYSKNKRGKVYIFIIRHKYFQIDAFYMNVTYLFSSQGEKMMKWTPWIQVLILMPQGTVFTVMLIKQALWSFL